MTAPFVAQLRSRPGTVRLGPPDAKTMSVRVEVPEVWDVVRIDAPPSETVLAVKIAALEVLMPGRDHRAFVIKLRGFEVLDESLSLEGAGATDGSIFLLAYRRRRPVR
jgi:hypothetical protein